MRMLLPLVLVSLAGFAAALMFFGNRAIGADKMAQPMTLPAGSKLQQATFAAGCFWGVEQHFQKTPGVVSTQVGYTGGHVENPTYKQVCGDTTGHAEAVLVTYDPAKISFAELLDVFWTSHDPTQLNRQGPDFGSQYRSAVFTHNDEQEKVAKASLAEVEGAKVFKGKIVTEITAATAFYPAEEYHQQYFDKVGGSCHVGPATVKTALAKAAAAARAAKP